MAKGWVRDYEAEEQAMAEQERMEEECMQRPYPYNIPNFLPFVAFSCYKVVDDDDPS